MVRQAKTHDELKSILALPGKVVFVDFFAKWCGPCKNISPVFEKLSGQYPDCLFVKVDIDEMEETAEEYNVQSLPTFMAFSDGQKLDEMVGASEDGLGKFVAKYKG